MSRREKWLATVAESLRGLGLEASSTGYSLTLDGVRFHLYGSRGSMYIADREFRVNQVAQAAAWLLAALPKQRREQEARRRALEEQRQIQEEFHGTGISLGPTGFSFRNDDPELVLKAARAVLDVLMGAYCPPDAARIVFDSEGGFSLN